MVRRLFLGRPLERGVQAFGERGEGSNRMLTLITPPGEIVHLNVLGQDLIVLNSPKAATDLLEKKSSTYSDRPVVMMCGEIIGWNKSLALTQYGPRFRKFRKYMSGLMGTRDHLKKFVPLQEKEVSKLVARVVADPDSLAHLVRK